MTRSRPVIACTGVAVLDHVFKSAAFPEGPGRHFASGYLEVGGGPAATAAVTIARLGGEALFWGRVGDDATGARILAELNDWGVDVSRARRCPNGRSAVSAVVVDDGGERMIVAYADPDLDPSPGWLPVGELATVQAILVDARWPQGAETVLTAAQAGGIPGILDADATPDDAARALLPSASHVAFSTAGLAQMTGTDDPAEGLSRAAALTDGWLAVTAGDRGCFWLEDGRLAHVPAFAVAVRDTLGAGDVDGLKIRTISSELQQELVRAMGGSPTPVAWPEVYTSLATGVVEGTKNGITDIVGMKFHEHLDNMTLDGHAYMAALWWMNNDAFMAMTPEERRIVHDGFQELRTTTIVMPKRRQIDAYDAFREADGTIYVPSPEEKAMFQEAAAPLKDWYTSNYGSEWLDLLQGAVDGCVAEIDAEYADLN